MNQLIDGVKHYLETWLDLKFYSVVQVYENDTCQLEKIVFAYTAPKFSHTPSLTAIYKMPYMKKFEYSSKKVQGSFFVTLKFKK